MITLEAASERERDCPSPAQSGSSWISCYGQLQAGSTSSVIQINWCTFLCCPWYLFLLWSRTCLRSTWYLLVRARALPFIRQFSWARLDMAAGCGKIGIKALRKGIKSRCDMYATRIMFLSIIRVRRIININIIVARTVISLKPCFLSLRLYDKMRLKNKRAVGFALSFPFFLVSYSSEASF